MPAQVANRLQALLRADPIQEFRRNTMAMGTDDVLQEWFRHLPTNWKKPSCAANAVSWNRLVWLAEAKCLRCSRSFVVRKKSDGTIPAPVGQARNTRSVTARRTIALSHFL